jgi:hypothetical protein
MTIEFDPTLAEFVEASLVATKSRRRKGWVIYLLLAGIFGTLAYFLRDSAVEMGMLAGWFILLGFGQRWMLRRAFIGLWKRHPHYAESTTVTLGPEGFSSENYSGHFYLRWHVFSHWSETRRLFLIFRGPQVCHYLPKRCLGGEAAISECRAILQGVIGKTQYVRPIPAFPIEPIQST